MQITIINKNKQSEKKMMINLLTETIKKFTKAIKELFKLGR